ncbi:hypothetical protein F5X99DRAFT_379588 [Biscogniauxia marginata]|nr:hypothetical protein F5X99DRAFT_379588 [Biscogniauxia marginata]
MNLPSQAGRSTMANEASELGNVKDMAESFCACAIANSEGFKGVDLPTGNGLKVTLEELDSRVRRLEARDGIMRPPPMQEQSWDALTWRLSRLRRPLSDRSVPKLVPSYIKTSLPLLKNTVESIPAPVPMVWPDEGKLDEKELLSLVLQWLCHIAGRRSFRVDSIPFEVEAVCLLALNLSLDSESKLRGHLNQVPFPTAPPVTIGHSGPGRICHGHCPCSYQKSQLRDVLRSILDEHKRDHRRHTKKWRVVRWFRKLAFWRRRHGDDDDDEASTISTTSSGTLMD